MSDLITAFIKLFLDNTVKIFPRLMVFVLIIIALITVDNILGFSFHYNTQRTISELRDVSKIISDTTIDLQTRAKAIEVKNEIISKVSIKDFFSNALDNVFRPIQIRDGSVYAKKYLHDRNRIIEFLCINWFLILMFLILPPYFLLKPAFNSFWKNLLLVIVVNLSLVILAFILFLLFSLIPTINGHPLLNYILDFSVLFIILMINTYKTKKDNWFEDRK